MGDFFNPMEVQDVDSYENLPAGTYRVVVLDSEYKTTKKGDGKYMAVAFQVAGGRHDGRKLFTNFNIQNPNETAERIGKSEMKKFLASIGHTAPLKDENEFHRVIGGKTLAVDVEIEHGKDGRDRNRIKRFMPGAELPKSPSGHQASSGPMSESELPF